MALSSVEIARFLAACFATDRYPESEQGGLYKPSDRAVGRIGLALEPTPAMVNWAITKRTDAVWLHRPWQLATDELPADVSVLYHHLPFDETLTMGFNQPLAQAMGMTAVEPLGFKQSAGLPTRAIGMIGDAPVRDFAGWCQRVKKELGGYDQAVPGESATMSRLAVVGAMNDQLVREAAQRGATLFLTGQYRKAAQEAVDKTGLAVIAVGHRRSEEWGLRALATILHTRFPTLEVMPFSA